MPETVKSELFPCAVGIEITRPVKLLRKFLSPLDKGHFITGEQDAERSCESG